jgi:hypothetical protein
MTYQYNHLGAPLESERLSPVSGRRAFDAPEALALLQKGVILFQRKVYDGAMRTLTEYRRHLDGRSPDATDENRHRPAWFSLQDCGSRCQSSGRDIANASIPDAGRCLSMHVPYLHHRFAGALVDV